MMKLTPGQRVLLALAGLLIIAGSAIWVAGVVYFHAPFVNLSLVPVGMGVGLAVAAILPPRGPTHLGDRWN